MSETLHNITPRPEDIREDFIVPGSIPGTFRYPYESTRDARMAQQHSELAKKRTSPYDLEACVLPDGSSYFQAPHTNITEVISSMSDVVVEVGGPTETGYISLNSIDLKGRPIITNVGTVFGLPGDPLTAEEKLMMGAMADARRLPLRSGSVGLLLGAHIPKTALTESGLGYHGRLGEDSKEIVRHAYESAIKKVVYSNGRANLASEMHASPRIGLLVEAKRILRSKGVFVMRGVEHRDIALADVLGFDIIGHDPIYTFPGNEPGYDDMPNEIVFQKNR